MKKHLVEFPNDEEMIKDIKKQLSKERQMDAPKSFVKVVNLFNKTAIENGLITKDRLENILDIQKENIYDG